MNDPLDDYRKKRDFGRTPEPAPAGSDAASVRQPGFVVHRHEARNLHYDLRLEVAGVLRCWAVPRGFSYDPADKRLAVQTEDHPLDYEHFRGRIPKGEYGAGTMTVWDQGRYELVKAADWQQAMAAGEVKLKLYGRRLRGEWHLVKTTQGPRSWLLFKSRDRYAGSSRDSALGIDPGELAVTAMHAPAQPMRWLHERAPFTDPQWLFEVEFAGQRCCLQKRGDEVRLIGVAMALPAIEKDARQLRCDQALLDGVLVASDEHQRPDRHRLERQLAAGDGTGLLFYAFDLLHWEDYDLRALPLLDRKAALRGLMPPTTSV